MVAGEEASCLECYCGPSSDRVHVESLHLEVGSAQGLIASSHTFVMPGRLTNLVPAAARPMTVWKRPETCASLASCCRCCCCCCRCRVLLVPGKSLERQTGCELTQTSRTSCAWGYLNSGSVSRLELVVLVVVVVLVRNLQAANRRHLRARNKLWLSRTVILISMRINLHSACASL